MGSIGTVVIGMYLVELEALTSSPGHQRNRVAIVCTLPQYEALRYPPDTLLVLLRKDHQAPPLLALLVIENVPLGYFIGFPAKLIRLVTGSFDEYRTSRRGTLKLAHLCSPIK